MMKQVYEDYKYVMMDTGYLYIGAKYTYGDLMELDTVPFKFMTVVERYILPDMNPDTTIESHLYYLQAADFTCRTLQQLKAKVKVNRLTVKKKLFGKKESVYQTEIMSLQDFVKMSPDEKERAGIFIQELVISKLGLMSFMV
jgi:hypothetical protein